MLVTFNETLRRELVTIQQRAPRGWLPRGGRALNRFLRGEQRTLKADVFLEVLRSPYVDVAALLDRLGVEGLSLPVDALLHRVKALFPSRVDVHLESLLRLDPSEPETDHSSRCLDELRHSDPDRAWKLLQEPTARHSRLHLRVYAELRCYQGRHGLAARAYLHLLEITPSSTPERGHLLEKIAFLLSDQGWYRHAFSVLSKAMELALFLSNRQLYGELLVSRSTLLAKTGQFDQAMTEVHRAIPTLADSSWPYRFAAHYTLACASFEQGEIDQALDYLKRAISHHRLKSGPSWARALWLRGRILVKLERFSEAEEAFLQAKTPNALSPIDRALLLLELAIFRARTGRATHKIVVDCLPLLRDLQPSKVAQGILLEVIKLLSSHTDVDFLALQDLQAQLRKTQRGYGSLGGPQE